jgi:hypothetical protein
MTQLVCSNREAALVFLSVKRTADMIDPKDPLKDGLTPPDYDEYGDNSDENAEQEEGADPKNEPNPGESPLG